MSGGLRVYYYFLAGAFGGLTGWFLASLVATQAGADSLAYRALGGALLGAPVCAAVAACDGLGARSFGRLLKLGAFGLVLGALAGCVAAPAGQAVYEYLLARLPPSVGGANASAALSTLSWVVFGGAVGCAGGIIKGAQFFKRLLGGALGGLSGALVHEILLRSDAAGGLYAQQGALALALALLGGCVGASAALVRYRVRRAWVEVLTGKFAGLVYDVTKYVSGEGGAGRAGLIGSDERRADIYLTADQEVLPLHARLGHDNGAPVLTALRAEGRAGVTLVNGRRAAVSALRNGDRIQLGSAVLIYRDKYK